MKIETAGPAAKTENFMTYKVEGNILVGRGIATIAAWRGGEILWDHVTPLKMDRTKEPLAVGNGKVFTGWADTKRGPTRYEARGLVTGELLWHSKLTIRADREGLALTHLGLAVAGYHDREKRNFVAFLDPENGEQRSEFYCKGVKGVAGVGESVYAWGPYGVFHLDGDEFRQLNEESVVRATPASECLFVVSRDRSRKMVHLRRCNLGGELERSMVLSTDGNLGGRHLVLDKNRILTGMDPGTGPSLIDIEERKLLWTESQDGRSLLSLWRLGPRILALCNDDMGGRNVQSWDIVTGEHSRCDDLGYIGWAAVVDEQLVLGHGEKGIQAYNVTFPESAE